MNLLKTLVIFLFSINAFAAMTLDIDYSSNEKGKKIRFKDRIETYIGEIQTIVIPESNKSIEIRITDEIPEALQGVGPAPGEILVDMRVMEDDGEKVKVVSKPKIVTTMGNQAWMETYEDKERKKPVMTLKVTPRKLEL